MNSLWSTFAGDDSFGTALANLVTIAGVLGGIGIALHISGTFSASLALSARFLQTTFKLTSNTIALDKADLPPGDLSRVFYEAYAISRAWSEPYWTGNLRPSALKPGERAAYVAHVEEMLFLLDRVLRHAPSQEARNLWVSKINAHVFAHGHLLKQWVWRCIKLRRYSLAMQTLVTRAPSPKAPAKTGD
jgi:hypothetical protein